MKSLAATVLLALLFNISCSDADAPPSNAADSIQPEENAMASFAPPQSEDDQYFPELAFSETEDHHQFVVDWYSKHLSTMAEPSLYDRSRDMSAQEYRFLWLPTWGRPVAVRLTVHEDGSGALRSVVLDGSGGYEPGKIQSDQSRSVSSEQIQRFLDSLNAIDYWSLNTRDADFGLDGEQYILEAIKDGRYQVVDRWSPEGAFADTCRILLDMAGLK